MQGTLRAISFDLVTEGEAIRTIIKGALQGRGGRVLTPNVDILRMASRTPRIHEMLVAADLVLADGMPVVWALRHHGYSVPARVAGSSLGPHLAEAALQQGLPLFLIGGKPGAACAAAEGLSARWPHSRVAWYCPPVGFEADPEEQLVIADRLREFGPAVCLCGFGFPKDGFFGETWLPRQSGCWFIGVGATIDFMAGAFPRAPRWMQATGLEWLFRLALEPKRLTKRYLVDDVPFALGLIGESMIARIRSAKVSRG